MSLIVNQIQNHKRMAKTRNQGKYGQRTHEHVAFDDPYTNSRIHFSKEDSNNWDILLRGDMSTKNETPNNCKPPQNDNYIIQSQEPNLH